MIPFSSGRERVGDELVFRVIAIFLRFGHWNRIFSTTLAIFISYCHLLTVSIKIVHVHAIFSSHNTNLCSIAYFLLFLLTTNYCLLSTVYPLFFGLWIYNLRSSARIESRLWLLIPRFFRSTCSEPIASRKVPMSARISFGMSVLKSGSISR